jgi:signal peptidase I
MQKKSQLQHKVNVRSAVVLNSNKRNIVEDTLMEEQISNTSPATNSSTKNMSSSSPTTITSSSSSPSIIDNIKNFPTKFKLAASEGFGTKARNVGSTMSVGDIVVPICGNLALRQIAANKGIYAGVEYEICSLSYNNEPISTISTLNSKEEAMNVIATLKPAYKLRDYLERDDWPVTVKPNEDIPLWLSKTTYEAGTMLGTLGLSATYLSIAAILAFFVRFAYVPSESMIPSLNPGDVAIVTRSIPIGPLRPKAGDVILFDPPSSLNEIISNLDTSNALKNNNNVDEDDNQQEEIETKLNINKPQKGEQFLKRVVATPGEVVGVKNGNPYVAYPDKAGSTTRKFRVDVVGPYSRPDLFPPSSWDRQADIKSPLKKNEYFVAGDNGYRSVDSRVWGPLKEKYIFGTAKWIVWPLQDFGPVQSGQISNIEK